MRATILAAQMLTRLVGTTLVILGLLFWSGNALNLIQVHMLLGFVLVLLLWSIAALALRAGVEPWLVALGVVWGLVVPALGVVQARMLPGSLHWVVQVLHLVVGLTAIGLADVLANRARDPRPSVALRKARASLTAPW